MNRRTFIGSLTGGFLAAPLAAEAQPGRVYRIGVPPALLQRADQIIE